MYVCEACKGTNLWIYVRMDPNTEVIDPEWDDDHEHGCYDCKKNNMGLVIVEGPE